MDLEPIFEREDILLLEGLIKKHVGYTGSPLGKRILENWAQMVPHFVKVFPHEYKRVLGVPRAAEQKKPASAPMLREPVKVLHEGVR